MARPKVVVRGRKVILLSGYENDREDIDCEDVDCEDIGQTHPSVVVSAEEKLRLAAKRDPDAVAFGFVAGEWFASA